MSVRKKYDDRCARCLMRQELCICALIPTLKLATKVVIVISKRELLVPTNTGRLAALALPHSALISRGDQDKPYDLNDHLTDRNGAPRPSLLLYPAEDAQLLTPLFLAQFSGPINLVVPDGNWRQTSKMRRRDPVMATLPTIKLPDLGPSTYRVRKETKSEGLATIEAIARALGIVEGPEVQSALEQLMTVMVERTLASRGQKS